METAKIRSYKELNVWNKGIEIVDKVYDLTKNLPADEKFGLISQMQRAAVSIPSNIAEGFARFHTKEYQRFCYIALGSCAELETHLTIIKRRNFISEQDYLHLAELIDHESKMLMNLIKGLR